MHKYFIINEEVSNALKAKKPIVALESTIISHGMPYPQNLETAKSLELIVRKYNCVPATIAIIKGKVHIGLSNEQLEDFAQYKRSEVKKASTRDLPILMAKGAHASTTVAATSYIASNVGIKFFATGGIGGVHKGVEKTMDISNDLITMSKTNMCIVSAGVKSILDIPKTLEMLETFGVPVVTYGSENFPAFYLSNSGVKSPAFENDLDKLALMTTMHFDVLVMDRAFFVANPISKKDEAECEIINKAIATSLKEVKQKGILGRDITPYVLGRVAELTDNESLSANIKLVESNAELASKLAFRYHKNLDKKNFK